MARKTSGFDNKAYQNEYHRGMLRVYLSFNPNNEEDRRVFDYVQSKPNKTEYIRRLILDDMRVSSLSVGSCVLQQIKEDGKRSLTEIEVELKDDFFDAEGIERANREGHRIYCEILHGYEVTVDVDEKKVLRTIRRSPKVTGI